MSIKSKNIFNNVFKMLTLFNKYNFLIYPVKNFKKSLLTLTNSLNNSKKIFFAQTKKNPP